MSGYFYLVFEEASQRIKDILMKDRESFEMGYRYLETFIKTKKDKIKIAKRTGSTSQASVLQGGGRRERDRNDERRFPFETEKCDKQQEFKGTFYYYFAEIDKNFYLLITEFKSVKHSKKLVGGGNHEHSLEQ